MLQISPTPLFSRDLKKLINKHTNIEPLDRVVQLIIEDSAHSKNELKRRHKMHKLKGEWKDSLECHVANAGDWLLVWAVKDGTAYLQRTGTHDEIFRK